MNTENTTAQNAGARITANYRQGQFDRLPVPTEYKPKVKFIGVNNTNTDILLETNYMDITADELEAIRAILTKKAYTFDELPEDIQQKIIENHADINVDYEWWDSMYEDAKTVLLKLDGFDLDRNRQATGDFIENAEDTAKKIISEHGEKCDSYTTAVNYFDETRSLWTRLPEAYDDEWDGDDNEYEREDAEAGIDAEFLRAILEDYSIMLQKEFEYLTSEEAIIETIKVNEYLFTEDGEID